VLVPLVFASIVVGVANLRQHSQMHRVWQVRLPSLLYTVALAGRRHRSISENT
jgi:Na+/H+-dicarboxylate symporter